MTQPLRISVIGTGHLGSIHTRLWKNVPNALLAGIYDVNEEQKAKIATENSCTAFTSIEELLASSDAVTIAAPTSLHFEIAQRCIESGVHCFIEKPITTTHQEAASLIEQARSKNVLIQVGHVERFNPALAALKDYNLNPLFIEAHRLSQFKPRATDVSVVLDLMIHDIDIMLWLVKSQVEKIDANGVPILTDTPDIANARIRFKNGAVANLTASRISARPMRKMRLFQRDAYISIDFGKSDVEVFGLKDNDVAASENSAAFLLGQIDTGSSNNNITYEKPKLQEINAIAEEQKAFVEAILERRSVAVSAEEAAEALRIAELISAQIQEQIEKMK